MKILVINPGSTSTKMAVYENETPILLRNIAHSAEELAPFGNITEQQDFRRQLVLDELKNADIPLEFDAVIGRGGLVKPISGGVYEINQRMLDDTLHGCVMHSHACNLGCLLAYEIAAQIPLHCRPWCGGRTFTDGSHQWFSLNATHLHLACLEPESYCQTLRSRYR